MFTGVIIEESLVDTSVMDDIRILKTDVKPVTERYKTPWVTQWTMHEVEIDESQIESVTIRISRTIDPEHANSWYADFKSDQTHYIVFRDKVFIIDRTNKDEYAAAVAYGASIGIPAHQLDFAD